MLPSILACPLPMSRWPLPPLTHCSFGIVSSSHPGSNHSGSAPQLSKPPRRPALASWRAPPRAFCANTCEWFVRLPNLMMTTKTLGRRMPWSEHSIAAKLQLRRWRVTIPCHRTGDAGDCASVIPSFYV